MRPEDPLIPARAFYTAFKQTKAGERAAGVCTRSRSATSNFGASCMISGSFVSSPRLAHKVFSSTSSTRSCSIGSILSSLCVCLAKQQKRHIYTSSNRFTTQPRQGCLYTWYRTFWKEKIEFTEDHNTTTTSAEMLGGTSGGRRRSLRLSSSRKDHDIEPLRTIVNNEVNANNGTGQNYPITVAIEGNIGIGKSTLLNYFAKQEGVQVVMEPVAKWRENKGYNMLDLLYREPSRWSFTFQSFVQLTMLQQHHQPHTAPIKMMERSLYSAKYCFVEHLHKSKQMNGSEYMVLTEWFDWILNTQDVQLDQIVYLRTSPEMCQKRIKQRCRSEEQGIPLQYLQELHELHEDWLIRGSKFKLPAPVMVLDASKPLDEMFESFEEKKGQILLQC